jgi:hypothetical protein
MCALSLSPHTKPHMRSTDNEMNTNETNLPSPVASMYDVAFTIYLVKASVAFGMHAWHASHEVDGS